MFAVIFEVKPRPESWDAYLSIAGRLRPELERIEGFVANERFRSRAREGWLLSLSWWRDEKALVRWRSHGPHHAAQVRGRAAVFEDYHLRVGEELAAGARADETEVGSARALMVGEGTDAPLPAIGEAGLVSCEAFESIVAPGRLMRLVGWASSDAAAEWRRAAGEAAAGQRIVRVIRDYGMHDRREAPQYHAPAGAGGTRFPPRT